MLLPSCFCSGTHRGSWWGLCHAIPWACNALIPRLPVAVPFHSPSQPFPDNQSTWTTWYPHVPCAQTISRLEGRLASQVQRTQNSAWFPEVASEHRGWWLAFMNEWANEQRNITTIHTVVDTKMPNLHLPSLNDPAAVSQHPSAQPVQGWLPEP